MCSGSRCGRGSSASGWAGLGGCYFAIFLIQKLNHDVEAFIRMLDDHVLLPDGSEAIPAQIANAFGKACIVGREFQVGAIKPDELR